MSKFTPYLKQIQKMPELLSIQLNLLNACTSKCQSCRRNEWPKGVMLDINIVKDMLMHLRAKGLETVLLSGGDPILYPHLEELVRFIKSLGMQYSIITTLITRQTSLIRFIAQTAERIHVSVDSATPSVYASVRGTSEGAFELVKTNLNVLKENRNHKAEKPRISFTLSKLNYREVGDMISFADEHNCNINFYFVHTWEDLMLSANERVSVVDELNDAKRMMKFLGMNILTNVDDIIKELVEGPVDVRPKEECIISKIHAIIDFDGAIFPCCTLSNDNGAFDADRKYAYGNIKNLGDFAKRFNLEYPRGCELCRECNPRYVALNHEYEESKKNRGLFL